MYTDNIFPEYETAYLVHYVGMDGEYLYALPVSEPGNADAYSGEGASLIFSGYEPDTWSGKVKLSMGEEKEITVPVLRNPETGGVVLGDLQRKVICADKKAFDDEDTIDLRVAGGDGFADNELLIYDTFLRVYDTYESAGWQGPDGDGSPVLLLMDWVDENDEPLRNACYGGRKHGFQTFGFNRLDPDGENTDVIAHEFTHCVTDTLMGTCLYYNTYGAINEAYSDICGNLVEEILGDTEDETWLVGEHEEEPYRSMSDPNRYGQPAFVWDKYFVPPTDMPTERNDMGGVHGNSSLLNLLAYRLKQSGMPAEDQLYFWMNTAMGMTPLTEYGQMTKLLPWTLDQVGYSEYKNVIEDAANEIGLADTSLPDEPAEGLGMVRFEHPAVKGRVTPYDTLCHAFVGHCLMQKAA